MKKRILLFPLIVISLLGLSQPIKGTFNSDSLISLMTLREKTDMISGHKNFNIKGNNRLGIPQIKMADGPMGVVGHGKATAFPASICMAATWNPDLIKEMAGAIAVEARSKGIGILLAPGVNMYRVPHCGRNFEYYGEDPYLASEIAVSFIKGVQNEKVMATVKHFVANNHDYDRHRVSSNIDERTLNEIYFPVFKAAVHKGKVGAVMTSYNLLNGIHTSESPYLIKQTLKEDWNFDGIVMSDWISVYSIDAFNAGLDLEMPRPQFMNYENISSIMKKDPSSEIVLNDKIRRIISTCNRVGLYNETQVSDSVDWIRHSEIAKKVACEGFVLLKNADTILPLNNNNVNRILVLGPNASYTPHSGGGAAMVDAYRVISSYDGIKNNALKGMQVDYLPVEGMFHMHSSINREKFFRELSTTKNYDAIILCLGYNSKTEGEAFDRPFNLPKEQELLINEITKHQENIIVVLNAGGGVTMPWIDKIKALLYTWYPGQEGGDALGEILFGITTPSGKLPISIGKQWKNNAAFNNYDTTHAIPGAKPFYTIYGKEHEVENMNYEEGIFTGYRFHDLSETKPMFPFGFGLSYTTFELSDPVISSNRLSAGDSITMQFMIENTGNIDGSETIQLYIHDLESSVVRPIKELKAFQKVFLKPGEKSKIEFIVYHDMLSYYDTPNHNWKTEAGYYEIQIGNSSDKILLHQRFKFIEK
jgi:beta-glucosidase